MNKTILLFIIGCLFAANLRLHAQSATHLQVDLVASTDSFPCKVPFYVRLSARDAANNIDTSYGNSNAVTVSVLNGPGTFNGPFSVFFSNGIAEFSELSFNTSGTYSIMFSSGSLIADTITIKMAHYFSFTNSSSQLKFFNLHTQDSISKSDFLFRYVIAINASMAIDTTYNSSTSLSIAGSGSIMGTTTKNFNKGIALFTSLSLTDSGSNQIVCSSGSLTTDTCIVVVGSSTTGNGNTTSCDTTTTGVRKNLGLYGGSCLDLTFSPINGRLFAGVRAPASIFYSDDTAKTWKAAFPIDSLEFNCGMSGWGGSGKRVMANHRGWVAAYTEQQLGMLKSTVVSFHNGDSGSWQTAADANLLMDLGYNMQFARNITLTDYYMYSVLTNTIVMRDSSGIKNIIDASQYLGTFPSNNSIVGIAAANDPTGLPFYIVVDTTGDMGDNTFGKLYRFNGATLSEISLPTEIKGVSSAFIPPLGKGDTLFICSKTINTNQSFTIKIYRSFDGGVNWQDITWTSDPNSSVLSDVDYSASWSGEIALILQGKAVSNDLGTTWLPISSSSYDAACFSPTNQNMLFASKNRGVEISPNGPSGSFTIANNYGLEAIQVNKIARTSNKSVFYIATRSGLAYTTAYQNNSISEVDKWKAPYGEFPVASINDSDGVFAVAIDPTDSLHVIAGDNFFNVSFSGPSGFQKITPSLGSYIYVTDILFVNSNVVLAVTGRISEGDAYSEWGDIWRTTDGGLNWTKVSPAGFYCGNTIAMGITANDTILYAGSGFSKARAISDKPGVLWKSTDLGITWTGINAGPYYPSNSAVDSMPILDIAVDPRGSDTLYIASGHNTDQAFVISHDGGQTYYYTNITGEGEFSSVAIHLAKPDSNVYVANRRKIFSYNPITDSAELLFTGLPGELTPDIAYGSILAGTTTGFYGVDGDGDGGVYNQVVESTRPNQSILLYPNPATQEVTISIPQVHETHKLEISLISLSGQHIQSLFNGHMDKNNSLSFNVNALADGIYYIKIVTADQSYYTKLVVLKK